MNILIFLHPYADWGLLALRIGVGAIFWVHGMQKMSMWKMQPSEQMPKQMLGIMKLLSICESLGAIALIFGFLTQWAALGLAVIMLGAMNLKITKWHTPFTARDKTGWELDLILLAANVSLLLVGAGSISLDRLITG